MLALQARDAAAAPRPGHRGGDDRPRDRVPCQGSGSTESCATSMPSGRRRSPSTTRSGSDSACRAPIPWWSPAAPPSRRPCALSDQVAEALSPGAGARGHLARRQPELLSAIAAEPDNSGEPAWRPWTCQRPRTTLAGGCPAGWDSPRHAFDRFWREVESVRSGETSPLRPEDLTETSLGALVRRLLRCSGSGCIVVTSFEPSRARVGGRAAASASSGRRSSSMEVPWRRTPWRRSRNSSRSSAASDCC